MTVKEITELRKSGQLTQALQAAESEFEQNPNKYNVGALFWCFNDLYKQQNEEEALNTIGRMKTLYEEYCEGDEFMSKALISAERQMTPLYQEIKNAVSQAKNGGKDTSELFNNIFQLYNSSNLDTSLYPDFGWLIYYVLKSTPLTDVNQRKKLLHQYLKLDLPRPSILHSRILGEAIKVEQNTPLQFRIRDFMRLWGFENLTDEDWSQFTTEDNHVLPSLVEKLVGVYTKEVKTDKVNASDEFCDLVDKALEQYPNNQNMHYFKSIVLISQGKTKDAIRYYKNLILKFPSKFYLWSQIAELVEDLDTKIGLLSKALTLEKDESFLGSVRLRMAEALITKGLKENAKYELDRYNDTYTSKGWNLKPQYWQLVNQLSDIPAVNSNQNLYSEYIQLADNFIYSSISSSIAVKVSSSLLEDKNHPGRKITIWHLRTKDSMIRLKKPTKFNLDKKMPDGSLFTIKVMDGKVVWTKPFQGAHSEYWIKESYGVVSTRKDRNGKRYAIVDGVYVGEKLLKDISEGETIRIMALRQSDGRWAAVSILN